VSKIKTKKQRYSGRLTTDQKWALIIGEDPYRPAFKSRDEMRAAWFANRDRLYRSGNIGTRESGWWLFEADGKDRNGTEALVYLIECGELASDEATHLRDAGEKVSPRYWPAECEAAWQARLSREAANAS
jgi:hypothetical protein